MAFATTAQVNHPLAPDFELAKPDVDLNNPAAVDAYDELPLWSAFAGQLLFRHLPLSQLSRRPSVLDVGCGTGFPAIELTERLGRESTVIGLDTWAEGLRRARRKGAARELRNISFVNGDASAMPFADRTFDLIVSNLGINNFDDPFVAVGECWRVARRDARLVLTTNLRGHWHQFSSIFESILDESARPALRRHIDHRATTRELRALLEASRFEVRNVEEEVSRCDLLMDRRFSTTPLSDLVFGRPGESSFHWRTAKKHSSV